MNLLHLSLNRYAVNFVFYNVITYCLLVFLSKCILLTSGRLLCALPDEVRFTDNMDTYVVYRCSNEKYRDTQYFRDFKAYMMDTNNLKAVYNYLKNEVDISEFKF